MAVARRRKPPGPPPGGGGGGGGGRAHKPRRIRVAAVSPAYGGRTHDKRAYERTRPVCPPGVPRYGDLGYQGTPELRTPRRRPPGGELTPRQRRGNRRHARKRVAAEHAVGKMKIWRIAADRYRGPRRRHTLVIKNVAGLHNLMFA